MALRTRFMLAGGTMAAAMLAAPAMADWTTISNPSGGGYSETHLRNILDGLYFSNSGALSSWDYQTTVSAGGVTIQRVHDVAGGLGGNGVGPLNIHSSYSNHTDQNWADGHTEVRLTQKFAGHNSTFGWHDGSHHQLFSGNPVQSATTVLSSNFQWYLTNNNTSKTFYSDHLGAEATSGPQTRDQFVSFYITGFTTTPLWVVAIEDLTGGDTLSTPDWDYNDMVIEFQVIPLPGGAGMATAGLAGIFGLGMLRRRRRAN